MKSFIYTALATVALAAVGCGDKTTDLTGKATYQGKPVVYGSVVVIDASGTPKSGVIEPDGTFRIKGVRLGPAKVSVTSPAPPGHGPAKVDPRDQAEEKPGADKIAPAPPEVIKNWFPIPDTYSDPLKSGLTADVKSGEPMNLDLK